MTLREMTPEDIDAVMEIERDLFTEPWTAEGFLTFLLRNDALFVVVEETQAKPDISQKKGGILGYAGILMVLDEGDITNVAVRRDRQKEGIGGFLLDGLFLLCRERGIRKIHLEVRDGNVPAIRLYERKNFVRDGLRKNYYTAPVEDAILMTKELEG